MIVLTQLAEEFLSSLGMLGLAAIVVILVLRWYFERSAAAESVTLLLQRTFQRMWRWRTLTLVVASLSGVAGYLFVAWQPPVFVSSARIQFDFSRQRQANFLPQTVGVSRGSFISWAEYCARDNFLVRVLETEEIAGERLFATMSAAEDREWLLSRLEVASKLAADGIVSVSATFRSENAKITKGVVNAVVDELQKDLEIGNSQTASKEQRVALISRARVAEMEQLSSPIKFGFSSSAVAAFCVLALCFVADVLDNNFDGPEDVESTLGLPILGHIPCCRYEKVEKRNPKFSRSVIAEQFSDGRVSESYRHVRERIIARRTRDQQSVFLVTSPFPNDGKSTLISNLGVLLAKAGNRTLIVEGDLRLPTMAKRFGIPTRESGLSAAIAGHCEIDDAIRESGVANLSLLLCGRRPPNPSEIVSSIRFQNLVDLLREKWDFLLIDAPPILAVSDAASLAAKTDATILTFPLRRQSKKTVPRALRVLDDVDANVIGVVVNRVTVQAEHSQYYSIQDRAMYLRFHQYGPDFYGFYRSYSEAGDEEFDLAADVLR